MAKEKVYKTEDGVQYPAEAYAYVPDPEKPSTWKLRLWEDPEKKETPRQIGMAVAALGKGFRGNKVDIPPEDRPKVIAKVRAAWKKVHPDASDDELPPVLREGVDEHQQEGVHLLEYVAVGNNNLKVDREAGVIRGVKVLGLVSNNGRQYTIEALRKALPLYEGRPVNIDHQTNNGPRSYRDRIGRIINVRLEDTGLYGDLVVNPKHPLAEQLFWDAEHAPEHVGLSHDARGKTVVRGNQIFVESIDSVRSVDLVAEPATTRSLYESVDTEDKVDTETDTTPVGVDAPETEEDPDTLPDDAFALVLPGGVRIRDKTYPLHKRYFPIHTPEAVKRSLHAILQNKKLSPTHKAQALERAKQAALRFGINYHAIVSTSHQEAQNVDLSTLTLAQLKEARPDLVEAIRAQNELEAEILRLKDENDRLQEEVARLKREKTVYKELQEARVSLQAVPQALMEVLLQLDDADKRKEVLLALTNNKPVSISMAVNKPDVVQTVQRWRG